MLTTPALVLILAASPSLLPKDDPASSFSPSATVQAGTLPGVKLLPLWSPMAVGGGLTVLGFLWAGLAQVAPVGVYGGSIGGLSVTFYLVVFGAGAVLVVSALVVAAFAIVNSVLRKTAPPLQPTAHLVLSTGGVALRF